MYNIELDMKKTLKFLKLLRNYGSENKVEIENNNISIKAISKNHISFIMTDIDIECKAYNTPIYDIDFDGIYDTFKNSKANKISFDVNNNELTVTESTLEIEYIQTLGKSFDYSIDGLNIEYNKYNEYSIVKNDFNKFKKTIKNLSDICYRMYFKNDNLNKMLGYYNKAKLHFYYDTDKVEYKYDNEIKIDYTLYDMYVYNSTDNDVENRLDIEELYDVLLKNINPTHLDIKYGTSGKYYDDLTPTTIEATICGYSVKYIQAPIIE